MLFVIMFIGSSFGVFLGEVPKSGGGWDSLSLLDAVEVKEEVRLSREMFILFYFFFFIPRFGCNTQKGCLFIKIE